MGDLENRIHNQLIKTIVNNLGDTPLILKGGTALMLAYNMDRYSEDIDYDSNTKLDLESLLHTIMQDNTRMNFTLNTKKDTDTTSRVLIHYSTEKISSGILKVEIKNNIHLEAEEIHNAPGFFVYSIDRLCQDKIETSRERIKPRDFYDLGYIANRYKKKLSNHNITALADLSNDKDLHNLYKKEWINDRFVREKPIETTINSLKAIKKYLKQQENDYEY